MLQLNKNKHYEWRNVWTLGNVVSYVYIIRQYQCDNISWEFMVNRMSQRKILVLKERSKIISESVLLSREVLYFFNVQIEGRCIYSYRRSAEKSRPIHDTNVWLLGRGIFNVPHLLFHGASVFTVSSKGPSQLCCLVQVVLGPILTRNSTWVYWRSLNQRIKRENRCMFVGVTWESIMHSINIC